MNSSSVEIKIYDDSNHLYLWRGRCSNEHRKILALIEEAKSKGLNVKSKNI